MKLTKREKTLLIVLGIIALLALDYLFLFKPQMKKIQDLILEQTAVKIQIEQVKQEIASLGKLQKNFEQMNEEMGAKTLRFYPEIIQEKIIVTLDEMFNRTRVKSDVNTFSVIQVSPVAVQGNQPEQSFPARDIVEEYKNISGQNDSNSKDGNTTENSSQSGQKPQEGINSVESMNVSIQFSAEYEQLMMFIKELEALDRTAVINNLMISGADGDILKGNMQVDFYALPKIHEQDKEYFEWPYNNLYGTENPFEKYDGYSGP